MEAGYIMFKDYINELHRLVELIDENDIKRLADQVLTSQKIYIIGNGGSLATASHFAEDLLKMCDIPAIAITDAPLITCFSNDYAYGECFSRALKTLVDKKDLIICISCSGNSLNIINTVQNNVRTFALLGFGGGRVKNIVKDYILVDSSDYQLVEDVHLSICHLVVKRLKEGIK